jgi:cobyrinic acid a,c-diamide synthase
LKNASLPPLLGAIPRGALPILPSRHLGLITADPQNLPPKILEELAEVFEKNISLDSLIQIAKRGSPISTSEPDSETIPCRKKVSIGLAYDKAFHFYYSDNLDELKLRGCDLIQFSPLKDKELPKGVNGLYLGGGYPEEYAEALADNQEMQEAIQKFAQKGLPVYAECGGLMYLTRGIEITNGKRYPMVGLLPAWSRMLDRLKSLGYVEVTLAKDSLWGEREMVLRGHEFHYSELTEDLQEKLLWEPVYRVKRRRSEAVGFEGFQRGKILASYVHLHWASQPKAMERFVTQCEVRL